MADRVEQVHAFPDRWVVREPEPRDEGTALVYRTPQRYLVCLRCASRDCTHVYAVEEAKIRHSGED